ncbi:hypothetical protein Tco_0776432 [Tanacetum coccineum]
MVRQMKSDGTGRGEGYEEGSGGSRAKVEVLSSIVDRLAVTQLTRIFIAACVFLKSAGRRTCQFSSSSEVERLESASDVTFEENTRTKFYGHCSEPLQDSTSRCCETANRGVRGELSQPADGTLSSIGIGLE